MYRYVIDSQDAKRNRECYIGCGGAMSYPAVIGTPVFSAEDDTEPVTLQEVKDHCAIDGNDFDNLLKIYITTAREQCEAFVNLSFINRTVEAKVRAKTRLPYGPVSDFDGITTEDGEDVKEDYKDLKSGVYIVTYSAGPPDPIPSKYKTAVLNQVAYLYEHRGDETSGELSPGTKAILKPLRIV